MLSRHFEPTTRRYGKPTLPPDRLVIDSPKYDFSKLMYFQFMRYRSRPLWVEKRSIVIAIDGACRGNNLADEASRRASYGVYFGIASPHNFSGRLSPNLRQSSNRAEIEAAVQAIERLAELDLSEQRTNKVIIKTDSEYLSKSMTEWMGQRLDNGGRLSGGGEVQHWPALRALHQKIGELEENKKLEILFWRVPREYNTMADKLANAALGCEDSGFESG